MPRFRNKATGAVVSVSDEKGARLGHDFEPLGAPRPAPTAAKERRGGKRPPREQVDDTAPLDLSN